MSSLYLDHFGLAKPPFQITPDLGFFFSGGRRGDILSALLHVAQHEEGIMTLVAEVGSGKTMLARMTAGVSMMEVLATGAMLAVFVVVEMYLLGRVFQASLLRTGQPPKLGGFIAMMFGKQAQ